MAGFRWEKNRSLNDLALDAAAALKELRAQPQTDAARCGYWGISQGGWVVPLASGISTPAFSIIISGGGLSPREVELAAYRDKVGAADISRAAAMNAESVLSAYFDYLAGEREYRELMDIFERYRNEAWFESLGIEGVVPSEANRANWQWVATFNPSDSIASLESPVLVILGGKDPLTPATPTQRAWKANLDSEDCRSRVVIFPDAGHGIRTAAHHGPFAEGFFEVQRDWLAALGILK